MIEADTRKYGGCGNVADVVPTAISWMAIGTIVATLRCRDTERWGRLSPAALRWALAQRGHVGIRAPTSST
jgi:hypothetical protein